MKKTREALALRSRQDANSIFLTSKSKDRGNLVTSVLEKNRIIVSILIRSTNPFDSHPRVQQRGHEGRSMISDDDASFGRSPMFQCAESVFMFWMMTV